MKQNRKKYEPQSVWDYIEQIADKVSIDIIEGSLIDTYILYHAENLIEVFEETYQNCWSSVYIRHIYKKLPARFEKALEDQNAYYDAL